MCRIRNDVHVKVHTYKHIGRKPVHREIVKTRVSFFPSITKKGKRKTVEINRNTYVDVYTNLEVDNIPQKTII